MTMLLRNNAYQSRGPDGTSSSLCLHSITAMPGCVAESQTRKMDLVMSIRSSINLCMVMPPGGLHERRETTEHLDDWRPKDDQALRFRL